VRKQRNPKLTPLSSYLHETMGNNGRGEWI
jgi:hypothetical protein